jgi:hypothetical protein
MSCIAMARMSETGVKATLKATTALISQQHKPQPITERLHDVLQRLTRTTLLSIERGRCKYASIPSEAQHETALHLNFSQP